MIDLREQIAEVEREIKLRERLYPRWVLDGKLSQIKADSQIATLRAVLDSLRHLEDRERPF